MMEQELSFEESLEKLEDIVNKLENGNVPLDDAIDEFKKAMDLVKICNKKLEVAEESIAKIVQDNGELIEFNTNERNSLSSIPVMHLLDNYYNFLLFLSPNHRRPVFQSDYFQPHQLSLGLKW